MRKGEMKNAAMVILAGCLWGVISIFVRQLNALDGNVSENTTLVMNSDESPFSVLLHITEEDEK